MSQAAERILALCAAPVPQTPEPPPQWKGPIEFDDASGWAVWSDCECQVRLWRDGSNEGNACDRHGFSALDSGLALLRSYQEKKP